jgi:hypothetical protein
MLPKNFTWRNDGMQIALSHTFNPTMIPRCHASSVVSWAAEADVPSSTGNRNSDFGQAHGLDSESTQANSDADCGLSLSLSLKYQPETPASGERGAFLRFLFSISSCRHILFLTCFIHHPSLNLSGANKQIAYCALPLDFI